MTEKEAKRAPDIQYTKQEYKNNHKIMQWPDGTVIVYNPESNNETLTIYHSSGSYHEFRGTGSMVTFASNNHLMYQKGGLTMSVDNNGDIKLMGHTRLNIDGDLHAEVAKNASLVINGMSEVVSRGHLKFAAADIELATTQGSIVINAARDVEVKADKGRILQHSSGVNQVTTDAGDFHVEVAGDILNKAQNIYSNAQQSIIEKATNINEQASQNIKNTAQQTATIEGGGGAHYYVAPAGVLIVSEPPITGGNPTQSQNYSDS